MSTPVPMVRKQFFGGAIEVDIPANFIDVRQVNPYVSPLVSSTELTATSYLTL